METLEFVQNVSKHAGEEGLVLSLCGSDGFEIGVQLPQGFGVGRETPEYRDLRACRAVDQEWTVEAQTELGVLFLDMLRDGELG